MALARKSSVESGLDALQSKGIVNMEGTPVKKYGEVRICGDFKVTVNLQLEVDAYSLPRIDEIYANLARGKQFSRLDLHQAYLQMELEEESKPYLTVNIMHGLYQYQRFTIGSGLCSSHSSWQGAMDQALQETPGVQCYLDDIIVTDKTPTRTSAFCENYTLWTSSKAPDRFQ